MKKLILQQLHSADYLVFVRITYKGMAVYWTKTFEKNLLEYEVAKLINSIPKLVFSKTLKSAQWNNAPLITENACEVIRKLKQESNKDMNRFGSANLSDTFYKRQSYR